MSFKYRTCFVLGPPGSGKGTQCANVSKNLSWVHLSAGDLLRAEQNRSGSEYGALIDKHIREGTIVPVKITCALIENAMKEASLAGSPAGFLIDGFPRNRDNLDGWDAEMSSKVDLVFVLFFECKEDTCTERILGRAQGRADDNLESLKKRWVTFRDQTKPIVDHFDRHGLIRRIDANRSPDTVWDDVKKLFSSV